MFMQVLGRKKSENLIFRFFRIKLWQFMKKKLKL